MSRNHLALILLLAPAAAAAQIGNPAGMGADTKMAAPGEPAPHQTNNTDRLFAQLLASGGKAEVELGQLAAERAGGEPVRAFGKRMAQDHDKGNAQLMELADAAKIPLPDALTPEDQALREKLAGLQGAAFDDAYMRAQITAHQKTAQLLSWELSNGQDKQMQQFAGKLLPVVMDHLAEANRIAAALTGAADRMAPDMPAEKPAVSPPVDPATRPPVPDQP